MDRDKKFFGSGDGLNRSPDGPIEDSPLSEDTCLKREGQGWMIRQADPGPRSRRLPRSTHELVVRFWTVLARYRTICVAIDLLNKKSQAEPEEKNGELGANVIESG
jgi:hypothetical protein